MANEDAAPSVRRRNPGGLYYPTKWMADKDYTYGARTIGSGYPPGVRFIEPKIMFIDPPETMSSLIAATIASGCQVEVVRTPVPDISSSETLNPTAPDSSTTATATATANNKCLFLLAEAYSVICLLTVVTNADEVKGRSLLKRPLLKEPTATSYVVGGGGSVINMELCPSSTETIVGNHNLASSASTSGTKPAQVKEPALKRLRHDLGTNSAADDDSSATSE